MRRLSLLIGVLCALGGAVTAQRGAGTPHPPEPLTTAKALDIYVRGDRAVITRSAPALLPPIWNIGEDLGRLQRSRVIVPPISAAETNRAIATFALEAARALETQSATSVCQLVANTRTKWLTGGSKTEFARRWHAAAIATLLRSDCLPALDDAITAALADFPTEPQFRLARVVAAEQQLGATFADGKRPSARELRDADTRVKLAMAFPGVAAEAALRWARINALAGQHEVAIALTAGGAASSDVRERYLAHLFRGWSLAAMGQLDEADAEYGLALALVPGAQSATLARAAAWFRKRETERAERLVAEMAARAESIEDPWWTYSIGDGRNVDALILDLRQAIR